MTQQCALCGAFIKAGRVGRCAHCGTEWDNGPELRAVPVVHNDVWGEDDNWAPGYCACGRWAEDCPGLAAVRRGEEPPALDRVVWHPVEL